MALSSLFFSPILAAGDAITLLNASAGVSERIAESWDEIWDLALDGALYTVMCNAGILVAVTSLLFFMLNFTKQWLENEQSNWVLTELIWPILVIILLANSGANLATLTLGMRDTLNHYNVLVLDTIMEEVEFTEVMAQMADYSTAVTQLSAEREQCNAIVNAEKLKQCLELNNIRAQAVLDEYRSKHPRALDWINDLQARIELAAEDPMVALDMVNDAVGFVANPMGHLAIGYMGNAATGIVEGVLVASQAAFQLILEASFLLTGLIGPIAVGGSLLPFGAKPIYAWATGFLSLGMCKLALNLITGLVGLCITNMPPTDTLPTALVIGLFAPVLAFAIAAGGGMAVFNGIASASATIGGMVMGQAAGAIGSVAGSAAGNLIAKRETGGSAPRSDSSVEG